MTPTGPDRLVKLVAVTRHVQGMAPAEQYPMGGGGLQWTLRHDCRFLVAAKVDESSIATWPEGPVFLGESAVYEDRAKLARCLDTA